MDGTWISWKPKDSDVLDTRSAGTLNQPGFKHCGCLHVGGQALYAMYQGNVFHAYELYLAAGQHRIAHELAVLELAPDAVIRNDLGVLRSLFDTINGFEVDGWNLRGKVCRS